MMGSQPTRQSQQQVRRKQQKQQIPQMDQKEGMKPSKQEEKQMKGNNPEREVANYGVVTEFEKQMMQAQKEKIAEEKPIIKEEEKNATSKKSKQTESENLIQSPEKQDETTLIGLIHSTQQMITGSIEKLKKLIDTSPQTLKGKISLEEKKGTKEAKQVQTQDLLQLKTEEKGETSTENKTDTFSFGDGIFQVYPEDKTAKVKQEHDYHLLAQDAKKTQTFRRQHRSKGEKNKKDSRVRKFSQQHPKGELRRPKLVKNNSIPLHSMEDEILIKKKSMTVQKSFEELNQQRVFDVPEFAEVKLVACKQGCGRKYSEDRIWKHSGICMFQHKHKLFDIQEHRLTSEEKAQIKKIGDSSKKKGPKNEMMMYNWRNKSSFLRALIKKNLKRRYKTFYDIKENCSSEEWEKKKANSACYKFWQNTVNYRQGQKSIEQLKRENVFDVPEFVPSEEMWMMQCREGCKRRFKLNCILSHEIACKRVFQSKRPVYNTRAHRMTQEQKKYAKIGDVVWNEARTRKTQQILSWKQQSQALWAGIKKSINSKYQTVYDFFFETEAQNKPEMMIECSPSEKQLIKEVAEKNSKTDQVTQKEGQKSQKPSQVTEKKTQNIGQKTQKTCQKSQQTGQKSQKISQKGQKSCKAGQKPCQMTQKACQTCKKPCQTCQTCQQTCQTCQKPCQTCEKPCEKTQKAAQKSQKTDQKTEKKSNINQFPCQKSQKPCQKNQKPCQTTEKTTGQMNAPIGKPKPEKKVYKEKVESNRPKDK